ncbi:MAG: hypothetical protein AB7O28_04365 [Vicinamibacterales bacterium]
MTKMFSGLALVGACSLLGAGTASALPIAQIRVPFAFTVESVRLPAGQYTVEQLDNENSMLAIRDANRHVDAIVLTTPDESGHPRAKSSLDFVKGEHGYELREVRAANGSAWELPR